MRRRPSVAVTVLAGACPALLVLSIGSMPTAPGIPPSAAVASHRLVASAGATRPTTTTSPTTTATATTTVAGGGGASLVSSTTKILAPAVSVLANSSPAFAPGTPDPDGADAPDPDIVESAGVFYAFSTGTALGNHLQVLVNTTGNPQSGYRSYTGEAYGSTALANPPGWETANTQTSPGVIQLANGTWIMYYDAASDGAASDTGHDCISYATASSLSPTDPQFTDTSSGPFYCPSGFGGWIDPAPFLDPATGQLYLVLKSNDGGSSAAAYIWAVPLSSSGTSVVGAGSPLFFNDTVTNPWEATVEDPSMAYSNGEFVVLFAGGIWDSANYAEGYAVCTSPTGSCTQPSAGPILSSYGSVSGPGGGSLFQSSDGGWWMAYAAWTSPCTSYSCGGARQLYVGAVSLAPPPQPAGRWRAAGSSAGVSGSAGSGSAGSGSGAAVASASPSVSSATGSAVASAAPSASASASASKGAVLVGGLGAGADTGARAGAGVWPPLRHGRPAQPRKPTTPRRAVTLGAWRWWVVAPRTP